MLLSDEKMQAYIRTAQRRQKVYADQMQQRYQQGWEVARQGARLLKEDFGASRVVVFGSLLDADRIYPRSDIDLAVWGMDPKLYFKAVACLQDLDPEFGVDLVEPETAYPHIREAISQGVAL